MLTKIPLHPSKKHTLNFPEVLQRTFTVIDHILKSFNQLRLIKPPEALIFLYTMV